LATSAKDNVIVASSIVADKAAPYVEAAKDKASSAASYVQEKTSPVVEVVRERASSIGESVSSAAVIAKDTIVQTAESAKQTASSTVHYVQEKAIETGTTISDTFKDTVTATALTIQEKANTAATSIHMAENVESLKEKTLDYADNVSVGAQSTWYAVSSLASAGGHLVGEKTHAIAESYNQRLAISESLDSKGRMDAARSALEHHAAVKQHRDLKDLNSVAAGLPEMKAKASEVVGTIPATVSATVAAVPGALSTAASTAGRYAQAAGEYVASGASSVYGAAVGAKESTIEIKTVTFAEKLEPIDDTLAKEKAIRTDLPVSERMEAAKSVLEHELSTRQSSVYSAGQA